MLVSDQIIKVLDNLCEKFGFAIDWTSENVLPYLTTLCTKLVSYEIWTSVAWLVICVVTTLVVAICFRKLWTSTRDSVTGDVDRFMGMLVSGVVGAFSIGGIISQIMDIIKCVTFPEMYVFEYIQRIISSAS